MNIFKPKNKVVKDLQERKNLVQKIIKDCIKIIHNAFPTDTVDIPKVLGDILYAIETKEYEKGDLNHLYFEWMSERYISNFIPEIIEDVKKIQNYLVERHHTSKSKGGHGCGDCYVYYIPHKSNIIQCYENQNFQFVLILKEEKYRTELHIRRFWDNINKIPTDDCRIYDIPESFSLRKLLKANYLIDQFSDDVLGNEFVKRPTLNGILSSKYHLYWDARDAGYILSYKTFYESVIEPELDCPLLNYGLLKRAFFEIKAQKDFFENGEEK